MSSCKFLSLNVKGINNPIKRKKILLYCKKENADVVLLQETRLSSSESRKIGLGPYLLVSHSAAVHKKNGVAILIKRSLTPTVVQARAAVDGRWASVVLQIQEKQLALLNIYAPNSVDVSFFQRIAEEVHSLAPYEIIVGGDLNLVLDPLLDCTPFRAHRRHQATSVVLSIMQRAGLADVWRVKHPTSREYSFFSLPHGSHSRIDYFLISKTLLPLVPKADMCATHISDHAAITFTLRQGEDGAGSTRFFFRRSLLGDKAFQVHMREGIREYFEANQPGDTLGWNPC